MGLREYIVKRAISSILLFFFAITFNFVLFRLMPGDPTLSVIDANISLEQRQAMIREFGLDRPVWEQYLLYVRNLFMGNMGISFKFRRSVVEIIFERRIWTTLILSLSSMFLSIVMGISLGIVAAWKRGKVDTVSTMASLLLYSTPVFWSGLIFLLIFGFHLKLIPVSGVQSFPVPTNIVEYTLDYLHHLLAPMCILALLMLAQYFLVMRNSLLDVFTQDYMLTAEAKGLSDRKIVFRHAFRNAILPSLSLIAARTAYLVSGATLTETVFAYNGIGYLTYRSIASRDFPVLQGIFLLVCTIVIAANFVADVMYAYLDPRIKY